MNQGRSLPIDDALLPQRCEGNPSEKSRARPINIIDYVILVLAMAPIFVVIRLFWARIARLAEGINWKGAIGPGTQTYRPEFLYFIFLSSFVTAVCLIFLTLACIAWRLRSPRAPLKEMLRQPGFAASIAVLAGLFASVCMLPHFTSRNAWLFAFASPGIAVIWAWSALRATNNWRAETSWIDRAGRSFGALWIVSSTLMFVAGLAMF